MMRDKEIAEEWLAKGLWWLAGLAMAVGLSLWAGSAWCAPFLVCDPYPATGQQPTEFVVTLSGLATPIVSPAVDVTGGKALKLDLGPLNLAGSHTVTAKARNAWGESAASSPFMFTAGVPAAPGGFGLSAP